MTASLYSAADQSQEIWVFLEQQDGLLENVSLEILSKGRQLANEMGWQLTGILPGDHVAHLAPQVFSHQVDNLWLVEHPLLHQFTVDAYTAAIFQALMERKPGIFLLGATHNGRDLAARLAVRLCTGLNADCTNLSINPDNGVLVSQVSGFGGGVLALIEMQHHRPQMATIRPGVFQVSPEISNLTGEIFRFKAELSTDVVRTRIIERKTSQSVDLTNTPVLVAGGRGMGGDFSRLTELAELLGGQIGATRPAVDMGIVERERQIGQTGVACSPKIAICCGISGAFHFVVGIEKAETVIAINSDPEAPIFEHADYCITGDVNQILPALLQALKENTEVANA